ncbi:unnamed protein product, partial [Musa textilis]
IETSHRRSSRDRSVKETIMVRNQPRDHAPEPSEHRSTESNQNAHGNPDRGARIPGSRSKSIGGERAGSPTGEPIGADGDLRRPNRIGGEGEGGDDETDRE